ncbi:MAG: N4-gp56 family major capsid protein [Rhodobacteraceae bacterium]|nr:N4-gp56 family major capsid protein [Paracoccaceae bacterium]
MANTSAATGLTVQQWDDNFFTEYVQDNPYARYMGTDENSIIQINEDLTKEKGDSITFALVNRLSNSAVTGSSTLEGNEEAMESRSHQLTIDQRRNAVRVPAFENQKSAIDLRNAARATLLTWSMEDTRDLTITAGNSKNGTAYGSVSEANKDIWAVDNTDRLLYGAVKSNDTGDHSADLAKVDNTADQLDTGALSLMKRIALTASPKIRPIRVAGMNKRFYVCFVHPLVMRDLKTDSVITAAQREVAIRNQNNKLFEGGDVEWDGIIVHEVDDMPILAEGAAGIDVSPVYFCGAQAFGVGFGKRWESVTEEFDYGDKHGVATRAWYGVDKLTFGSGSGDTDDLKDNGMVTGYFAAVADS